MTAEALIDQYLENRDAFSKLKDKRLLNRYDLLQRELGTKVRGSNIHKASNLFQVLQGAALLGKPKEFDKAEKELRKLLFTRYGEGLSTNLGPGSERYPPIGAQSYERMRRRKYKGGRPELEVFGLAGLPGGVRNDYDAPDSYSGIPQK